MVNKLLLLCGGQEGCRGQAVAHYICIWTGSAVVVHPGEVEEVLKKIMLVKAGIAISFSLSILAISHTVAAAGTAEAEPEAVAEADKDHDGVPDSRDKCPGTAQRRKVDPNKPMSVPVDGDGCARDTDGDGVADHEDHCPDDSPLALSAGIDPNGCPKHSDQDGTPDYRDKCPDTPAGTKTDMFGCPVYAEET